MSGRTHREVRWTLPQTLADDLEAIQAQARRTLPQTPTSEEDFALAMLQLGLKGFRVTLEHRAAPVAATL